MAFLEAVESHDAVDLTQYNFDPGCIQTLHFAPRRIMHVARDLIQSMAPARVAIAFPAPQLTCDDLLRLKLSLPAYSSHFLPLFPRRKQRVSFLAYTGSCSLGSGASRSSGWSCTG